MFGLQPFSLVCIGLAILVLLPSLLGNAKVLGGLKSAGSWFFKGTTGGTATTTKEKAPLDRREVLTNLDAAFTWFDTAKCQEGMKAVKTAISHAYEHREGE